VHVTDYLTAQVAVLSAAPGGAEGNLLQVRTRVTRSGKPASAVDYRLIARDDGWKVFDAVIQGVSLVSTLRAAVGEEIRRNGIDGLNARLQLNGSDSVAPPSVTSPPRRTE